MKKSESQDPLTYQIIGAGIEVHRVLGPGLLESLYEDAMCIELNERNLKYERQKPIHVLYALCEIKKQTVLKKSEYRSQIEVVTNA